MHMKTMKRKEGSESMDTVDIIASVFQSFASEVDLDDPTLLCQVDYDLLVKDEDEDEECRKSGSDSCESTSSSSLTVDLDHCHNKKRKEFPTSPSASSSSSSSSSSSFSSSLTSTTPSLELFNHGKGNEVILPKRRIRRVNNNPFPRILKSDIRRSLAAMYVNVMNSGDMEMVASFFRSFCVGHCESVHKINDADLGPFPPKGGLPSMKGLPMVIKSMQRITSIPDFVFRLEKSSIQHSLVESGSKVIMRTLGQHTIIDETFVEYIDSEGAVRRAPLPAFRFLVSDGVVKEEAMVRKRVVCHGAVDLSVAGWTIFHLDANRRIYGMEFQGDITRRAKTL
eukprot:scaffold2798_cov160-Ochromonas_danica.AAC.52